MGDDARDLEISPPDTGDPELDRALSTTLAAEAEYTEYYREERQRRAAEQARDERQQYEQADQQRREELEQYRAEQEAEMEAEVESDALDVDTALDAFSARVVSIDTHTASPDNVKYHGSGDPWRPCLLPHRRGNGL